MIRRLLILFVVFASLVLAAHAPSAPASDALAQADEPLDEVICDELEPCFSRQRVVLDEDWISVSTINPFAKHAYWTLNVPEELEYGIWQPSLPQAGIYDVYVWYPEPANRYDQPISERVTYTVHHADGVEQVVVNQRLNTGQWNRLASVPCASGTACAVRLGDATDEGTLNRRIWFDAVRFVRVSDAAPLNLEVSADQTEATRGDVVTVTATVSALVPGTATLTVGLPEGVKYVPESVTGGGVYNPDTHQLTTTAMVSMATPYVMTYQIQIMATFAPGTVLPFTTTMQNADGSQTRSLPLYVADASANQILMPIIIAADNDLSSRGLNLLYQLQRAADNPNVIMMAWLDGLGDNNSYLYRVRPQNTPLCPTYNDPMCGYTLGVDVWHMPEQMADPYSIAAFLEGALLAYPNARMVVPVFIGHGSGISADGLPAQPSRKGRQIDPLTGLLLDTTPLPASLSTQSLGEALNWSLEVAQDKGSPHTHFDGVYLDACLMGMLEVGYEIQDSADLLLASASVKWATFPYEKHIAATSTARDARDLLEAWLAIEAGELEDQTAYPYTYALLNLHTLPTTRAALDSLADALIKALPTHRNQIDAAFAATDCYDSSGNGTLVPGEDTYCDIQHLSMALASELSDQPDVVAANQQIQQALATSVVDARYQAGQPWLYPNVFWDWESIGAVSIYAPLVQDDWKRGFYRPENLKFATDSRWDEFLNAYWNAPPPAPPACPPNCGEVLPPLEQQPPTTATATPTTATATPTTATATPTSATATPTSATATPPTTTPTPQSQPEEEERVYLPAVRR